MTAKEFVKQKYPDATISNIVGLRSKYVMVWSINSGHISTAATPGKAWSLAKKLIIENEKLKKHETQTT